MDKLEQRVSNLEEAVVLRDKRIADLEAYIAKLETGDSTNGWSGEKVRRTFIEFFEGKEHTFWPSSSVVPHEDPTLLFANAGMNQYKPIFLGTVDPQSKMATLKRATNSQKCIRAGGKHNDLDDVGKDVYHHTFFEMLGNWSFGNYFKKEAIAWAWELLTEVYKIDKSRLYATYFEGDPKQGLPEDTEAKELWYQYLPKDRVVPGNAKDNFWEMGDTGPCGPCTEIHYDRIGGRNAAHLVNADLPEVLEIWNNVFMQFNRLSDGSLENLPAQSVDTGMGFERLASIMQDKMSNYDTDIFTPLFEAIYKLPRVEGEAAPHKYTGLVEKEDVGNVDMAYRVIADHCRTLTFSITDGCQPDKAGRGYVLRRILRRGVRYGTEILKLKLGFLSEMVDVVVNLYKDAFPELAEDPARVKAIIKDEEESFGRTLAKGVERFNRVAAEVKAAGGTVFPGGKEGAFFLYDSMGFPFDLTELMAEEVGLIMDKEAYDAAMDAQRASSGATKGKAKTLVLEAAETSHLSGIGVQPTDYEGKYTWNHTPSATVKAIFVQPEGAIKGKFVDDVPAGEDVIGVILDKTSYYAESGGQIYDTGAIKCGGSSLDVSNVQISAGFVLHMGVLGGGGLKVGDTVTTEVDYTRRGEIAPNHTMTHVLNFALRKTFPKQKIDQRGSFNGEKSLRFDFTCAKGLTAAELASVEKICQQKVADNLKVFTMVAPLEKAKAIGALRAVFGETYPDPVRVVSIGQDVPAMLEDPESAEWTDLSVEFCGGTHMSELGEAKNFLIINESAVSKGERRIEAVTGAEAAACVARAETFSAKLDSASAMDDSALVVEVANLGPELDKLVISQVTKAEQRKTLDVLITRVKKFKKALMKQREKSAVTDCSALAKAAHEKGEAFLVVKLEVGTNAKLGRQMMTAMSKEHADGSFMVFSVDEDKGAVMCIGKASAKHQEAGLEANAWVSAALAPLNGKGGGKKDYANGQAKGLDGLEKAMEVAKAYNK